MGHHQVFTYIILFYSQSALEDAEMIADKFNRTVIDSRDVLLNTLDKMIGKFCINFSEIRDFFCLQ